MSLRVPRGTSVEDRLRLCTFVAPSGCWIWLGALSGDGYGSIRHGGKTLYTHRLSYELHVGPIPPGYYVDHLCRRTRCLRPEHLQAVTPSVNTRRGTGPVARALRSEICLHGHSRATFGKVRPGGRYCGECHRISSRDSLRRKRAAERAAVSA